MATANDHHHPTVEEHLSLNREYEGLLSHPRSLTAGAVMLLYLIYAAFRPLEPTEIEDATFNAKRGIKYACLFFLVYCATQLRDGHFMRPHPVVWRIVTGVFILYEMFLIVLLFQPNAPAMMVHIDPSLGVRLPSQSYAEDCRLYTPENASHNFKNLRDTFFDIFVVMHFVGWFVGALMIRDFKVCWALSIFFEFYELSFEHWLPNFKECWWDHLVLDILGCNALGIWAGMRVCHWYEMKSYDWVGIDSIPNFGGKAKRAIEQFTPISWLPYDWEMLNSASRFWRVMLMIVTLSVMMLNSFFLKSVLWIPASHPLNVIRLCIWYSAGSYAVAEYYIFCAQSGPRKVRPRTWLGFGVVVTEVLVIVKNRSDLFVAPFPNSVKICWAVVVIVITFGSTLYFYFIEKKKKQE